MDAERGPAGKDAAAAGGVPAEAKPPPSQGDPALTVPAPPSGGGRGAPGSRLGSTPGAHHATGAPSAGFGTAPPENLLEEGLLRGSTQVDYNGHVCPSLGGIPLLRKLGQGGMGAVYSGIHPRLQVEVAVKVLPYQLQEKDPLLIERFFREAQISAAVRSPHLVNVMDVNEEHGVFYLVMEFVHGKSAKDYLEMAMQSGMQGVPERETLLVCIAAAEGLGDAHSQGIIHRDVKPDNVMIPYKPHTHDLDLTAAKLMDLGLARADAGVIQNAALTQTKQAMGTPGFMAPEQIMDARSAGPPADVFAMGATIYAMLAGQAPFKRKNSMQTLMATLQAPHEPITKVRPDVSAETAAVIDKCLAKGKEQRYQNGGELLHQLRHCLRQLPRKAEKQEGGAAQDAAKTIPPAAAAAPGSAPPAAPATQPESAPAPGAGPAPTTQTAAAATSPKPAPAPLPQAPAAPRRKPGVVLGAALGAAAVLLLGVYVLFPRSKPAKPTEAVMEGYKALVEKAKKAVLKDGVAARNELKKAADYRKEMKLVDAALLESEKAMDALIAAFIAKEENGPLEKVEESIKLARQAYIVDANDPKDPMTVICQEIAERRLKDAQEREAAGDLAAAHKNVKAGLEIAFDHPRLLALRSGLIEKCAAAVTASLARFAFADAEKHLVTLSELTTDEKRIKDLRGRIQQEKDNRDDFDRAIRSATKQLGPEGDVGIAEKQIVTARGLYSNDPQLPPLCRAAAKKRLDLAGQNLAKDELDEAEQNVKAAEALSPGEAGIAQVQESVKSRRKFLSIMAEAKASLAKDTNLGDVEKKIAEAERLFPQDPALARLRAQVKNKSDDLAAFARQQQFDAALDGADAALKTGAFEEAEKQIAAAEKIKPGDPLAAQKREKLGQRKEEARRFAEAQARRDKFLADLKQVDDLLKAGQLEDAEKRIAEAEKASPDDPDISPRRTSLARLKRERFDALLKTAGDLIRAKVASPADIEKNIQDADRALQAAAVILPDDKAAVQPLRELLDKKIEAVAAERKQRQQFDEILKRANAALQAADFRPDDVKAALAEAEKLYPGDPTLTPLREKLDKKIAAAEAAAKEKEKRARFEKVLQNVETALAAKDVNAAEVESSLKLAEGMYPGDAQTRQLRDRLDKKQAEARAAELQAQRQQLDTQMKAVDALLAAGDLAKAETSLADAEKSFPATRSPDFQTLTAPRRRQLDQLANQKKVRGQFEALVGTAETALARGDLAKAETSIKSAEQLVVNDPAVAALRRKLDDARKAAEPKKPPPPTAEPKKRPSRNSEPTRE